MNARILATSLLALLACSADSTDDNDAGNNSGKADDIDDLECSPADELSIELLATDKEVSADGDKLTNRVVAGCFDGEGFETAQCCSDAGLFDAYKAATGCPESVELSKVSGNASAQRCRDNVGGQFVDSACCAPLCDAAATRNGNGQCIDSNGRFEDEMCCFLAASLAADGCDGAVWESLTIQGEQRDACRGPDGRFVMNSCCAAECVAAVRNEELSLATIPDACAAQVELEPPVDECPDMSRLNAGGLCHNPVNGRFVKTACCDARGITACSFQTPVPFGVDNSGDLVDSIGTDPSLVERGAVSDLQIEQIGAALLHLGFLVPGQEGDLDVVFDTPDGGEFFYASGTVGDLDLDWVQFFAGDTEVGVVFEQGTARILGEVGDGDIQGCTAG